MIFVNLKKQWFWIKKQQKLTDYRQKKAKIIDFDPKTENLST